MDFLSPDFLLIIKLIMAMSLGLLLGVERTLAGAMAGMRTYALVSMGSCLLVVVAETVSLGFLDKTMFDPLRVTAGIVTGVGFLCGGLIVFQPKEHQLSGLTTAAGLWVATGIGITVGYGMYPLAIAATALALFVLSTLYYMEMKVKQVSGTYEPASKHEA